MTHPLRSRAFGAICQPYGTTCSASPRAYLPRDTIYTDQAPCAEGVFLPSQPSASGAARSTEGFACPFPLRCHPSHPESRRGD